MMIDFQQTFTKVAESLKGASGSEISLLGEVALPGVSSAASLVVDVVANTNVTPDRVAASANALTFEGPFARARRGVWAGDEVLSDTFGIREEGASIAEGQFLASLASGALLTKRLLENLKPVDGWYSGEAIDALAGSGEGLELLGDVFAMANNASLMTSENVPWYGADNLANTQIKMDGIYTQIRKGSVVGLEYGSLSAAYFVAETLTISANVEGSTYVPVTQAKLAGTGPIVFFFDPSIIIVHFDPRKVGKIEYIPTKTVDPEDHILDQDLPITVDDPSSLPSTTTDIIIQDAEGTALAAKGYGHLLGSANQPHIHITEIPEQGFSGELVKPVTFIWNLTKVTAGQTIPREVLGDGDGSIPFQTFELAKSPLTYVVDELAPGGRRPELAVYVNGVKWRRVGSFYGAKPSDEIYIIRHTADDKTQVIFGDGELGARVPTGGSNVVATYRFGVNGNVEANEIKRLARPNKAIKSLTNPLPAVGGEDPPTGEALRERLIEQTQLLGNLVSLLDFAVEARRYPGVLQARAEWIWDEHADDAVAKIWIVSPGLGDPSADLRTYLQARAEPATHVRVERATAYTSYISYDVDYDPALVRDEIDAAIEAALYDEFSGLVAPRNAPIGGRLFRSQLVATFHAVEGVVAVNNIDIDGEPLGVSISIPDGRYLALEQAPEQQQQIA